MLNNQQLLKDSEQPLSSQPQRQKTPEPQQHSREF
jgi:hypothetical protein